MHWKSGSVHMFPHQFVTTSPDKWFVLDRCTIRLGNVFEKHSMGIGGQWIRNIVKPYITTVCEFEG
jgi:hypothetical protein